MLLDCCARNIPYVSHGTNICKSCFDKGKRCQNLGRHLENEGNGCTYKTRFHRDCLLSYSEFCDWVRDLKDPRLLARAAGNQRGAAGTGRQCPSINPTSGEASISVKGGQSSSSPAVAGPSNSGIGSKDGQQLLRHQDPGQPSDLNLKLNSSKRGSPETDAPSERGRPTKRPRRARAKYT